MRSRPWVVALAVSVPLVLCYLILAPPSGDLAAATYRSQLFSHSGFLIWDGGWYGGHYLPGYSLLAPALGALLSNRLLLALSTVLAAAFFGLLARRPLGDGGARLAAASFALGACVGLLSGRVAYDLGLAVGLLATLALQWKRPFTACVLALLTSFASPVAGAFLALAGLAYALAGHQPPRGLRLAGVGVLLCALAPILAFTIAFPEGGYEPFAPSVFWPGLAGILVIALALPRLSGPLAPRSKEVLRWGLWLYAAALIGSYALHTPVGSNAARLGELIGAPLVAGVLWDRHRLVLVLVAPVLLYWQLETPINDVSSLIGDRSVNASYYAPLRGELKRLAGSGALRVEVPLTGAHWESVYLPEQPAILLARGWERQLDTRYASLFYGSKLSASAYRSWLYENAVSYVALPDVRLDFAGEQEGRLITGGLSYLRLIWRSAHWRVYAVEGARPLVQPPALLSAITSDSFTVTAPRPGVFGVRVRFTPYWAIEQGHGCVGEAPGGWSYVQAHQAGVIHVGIDFSLARVFAHGPRCSR